MKARLAAVELAPGEHGAGPDRRVAAGLALLALGARLPNLDAGLWFDEIWLVVLYLRRPFLELATTFDSDNLHPLYALLAWPCVRVFGEGPVAARLPALVFGVLSVPLVYVLGARSLGARQGFFAALLLAVSPHAVAFSQSARGYTGLLCFTLLSVLGFQSALRTGARRAWLLQGGALALAIHVHSTGVFLALAQLFAVCVERALRRGKPSGSGGGASAAPLAGILLGGALALVLHAPILAQMVEFYTRDKDAFGATVSTWKDPAWMLREMARSFGVGELAGFVALGFAALVFAIGFFALCRRDRPLALLAVLPAVLGQGTMACLGRNLWPRFFFSLAGLWLLVGVAGVFALGSALAGERGRRIAALALALAVSLLAFLCGRVWTLPKQDFESAVAWVEGVREPGDAVLSAGQAMFPLKDWLGTDYTVVEDPAALDAALAGGRRGWLVYSSKAFTSGYYPDVWRELEERGREVARFRSQSPDLDVVVLELDPRDD